MRVAGIEGQGCYGGTSAERSSGSGRLHMEMLKYQKLAQGLKTRRHHELPLARPAPHLGKLAGAASGAALRFAGTGRMAICIDDAAIRTPVAVGQCTLCGGD